MVCKTSSGLKVHVADFTMLAVTFCFSVLPRSLVRYLLEVKIVSARNIPASDRQQFVLTRHWMLVIVASYFLVEFSLRGMPVLVRSAKVVGLARCSLAAQA